MSTTTFTVADDKRTLIVERTFPAPKSRVWEAYTQSELLAQWWGPRGWETEIRHMDFTDGGYWHYGMKCVDPGQGDWYGKISWGKAEFDKIVPLESFEYTDVFCDESGTTTPGMPVAYGSLTLKETDTGTRAVTITRYETPESLSQLLAMGMQEGFSQTWDRLEELLRRSGEK